MRNLLITISCLIFTQGIYAGIPSLSPIEYSIDIKQEDGIEKHNQLQYYGFPIESMYTHFKYSDILYDNTGKLVLNEDRGVYLDVDATEKNDIFLTNASIISDNKLHKVLGDRFITDYGFDVINQYTLNDKNIVFIWNFIEFLPLSNGYKQRKYLYVYNIDNDILGYTSLISSVEEDSPDKFLKRRKVCGIDDKMILTNDYLSISCNEAELISGRAEPDTKTINVKLKITPNKKTTFKVIESTYPFIVEQ